MNAKDMKQVEEEEVLEEKEEEALDHRGKGPSLQNSFSPSSLIPRSGLHSHHML